VDTISGILAVPDSFSIVYHKRLALVHTGLFELNIVDNKLAGGQKFWLCKVQIVSTAFRRYKTHTKMHLAIA
jgi:hypothetical protein